MASNRENETLEQTAKRVFWLQVCVTVGCGLLIIGFGLLTSGSLQGSGNSLHAALSFTYGSIIGMVSTIVTKRSVSKASDAAIKAPQYGMLPVYAGLLNKLVIVAGGFAVGLIALGLAPIFLVSGYIAVHVVLMWAALKTR